ncbi:MAG: hypothetical protein ACOCTU_01500 [Bacteroidota bacterium]
MRLWTLKTPTSLKYWIKIKHYWKGKIRSVIDFVSGMTDLYAVDLYKDIKGISI